MPQGPSITTLKFTGEDVKPETMAGAILAVSSDPAREVLTKFDAIHDIEKWLREHYTDVFQENAPLKFSVERDQPYRNIGLEKIRLCLYKDDILVQKKDIEAIDDTGIYYHTEEVSVPSIIIVSPDLCPGTPSFIRSIYTVGHVATYTPIGKYADEEGIRLDTFPDALNPPYCLKGKICIRNGREERLMITTQTENTSPPPRLGKSFAGIKSEGVAIFNIKRIERRAFID